MAELLVTGPGHPLDVVGGKSASLERMRGAGLPVPPAATLTTAFFAPWLDAIQATPAWAALAASAEDGWPARCADVIQHVGGLAFCDEQRAALQAAWDAVGAAAVAARSSSPEEDLDGASFAGGYETVLGVRRDRLEAAVRRCFASCLDVRIMRYKRQRGFDPLRPRIAVILQAQIDSDVAGVGFSLNPLTNDYDEAVFDAAPGLGEAVVSGAVTPDHFVVDKLTGAVLHQAVAEQGHAVRLSAGGGTEHQPVDGGSACLSPAQLAELTRAVVAVEDLYGVPIDIEWAFAAGTLYLLQARPITAWVPLPEALVTAPGARRRLYQDIGLSGGLTINAPITPLGESWMGRFAGGLVARYLGPLPFEMRPGDELWFLIGGRMYQDLSNVLWMASPKMLARSQRSADALSADTLGAVDARTYRAARRPVWLGLWLLYGYPRAVWRLRGALWATLVTVLFPDAAHARAEAALQAFSAEMEAIPEQGDPLALIDEKTPRVIQHVLEETMPGMVLALGGQSLAMVIAGRRHAALAEKLSRGHHGNVVVEMSQAMHRLSVLLSPAEKADPEALAVRLAARDLPAPFLAAWDDFLGRFGWRGPNEVDLGAPRYADAPLLALRQICLMDDAFDPAVPHARHVAEREAAYAALRSRLGPVRRWLLGRVYRWIELFGGARDTPKHSYLMFFAVLRRRVMRRGAQLAADGRIDRAEDAVALRLEDLGDPGADLRARKAENMAFVDRLRRLVSAFPAFIDSRGRILRPPPRPEAPGEATGMPVSPGVARGPVVVLRTPDEKPVRPGDIIVAHTTDPGWTPLFVPAAAVILEVGGVLQHGAVVAREYGKPCVAGIPDLLRRFEDGQIVEVDGAQGVVRLVS